jgi:hypothetical protein
VHHTFAARHDDDGEVGSSMAWIVAAIGNEAYSSPGRPKVSALIDWKAGAAISGAEALSCVAPIAASATPNPVTETTSFMWISFWMADSF